MSTDATDLPSNSQAEQELLGNVLQDNSLIWAADPHLTGEHFYWPQHGKLWEFLRSRLARGEPCTLAALHPQLSWIKSHANLDVQDIVALMEQGMATRRTTEQASKLIIDAWSRRHVLEALPEVEKLARSNVDPSDAVSRLYRCATDIQGAISREPDFAAAIDEVEELTFLDGDARSDAVVPTGLYDVDKQLQGGFALGTMTIVAGRPSMGKSCFANTCIVNAAQRGHGTLTVSAEVPLRDLAKNMALITSRATRIGVFGTEKIQVAKYREALDELRKLPIRAVSGRVDVDQIALKAREHKARGGLKLLVVDYLQLLATPADLRRDSRERQVAESSARLKGLAMELDIAVVVLSQLNRAVESRPRDQRRPRLADLRESGAIEQDADAVLLMYRDAYYAQDATKDRDGQTAECIVAKQRNGPTGTVEVLFFPSSPRFESMTYLGDDLTMPPSMPEQW